MTKLSSNSPSIFITRVAKQKLDLYITHATGEIVGLGTVRQVENNFLIEDVFIFKQTASQSHADIDSEALGEYIIEMAREGKDLSNIKLFWHSHASMTTFWSQTDVTTIDGLSNTWMISIVGNKKGEYLTRFDLYDVVRVTIDDLPLTVYAPPEPEYVDAIKEEINEKVKSHAVGWVHGVNQDSFYNSGAKGGSYYQQQIGQRRSGNYVYDKDEGWVLVDEKDKIVKADDVKDEEVKY